MSKLVRISVFRVKIWILCHNLDFLNVKISPNFGFSGHNLVFQVKILII